ncbi:phosphoenolpyruvate synthase [Marinobacter orientalis]|uniref:Phosphoenolpyruvate synthase n=1 Tax=Marinobacter orientalis TaxID=1928859 RepID=A0A7Y0RCV5_9GAMM|nr:phosphoenolpyruvate synthase [Marinobacter orientalis]NMT63899.1 phosphoenolpyruvate synthase [Marinobacter orientalis]TGX49999.1 phosphoenolpyruvate synthase [Marinobacter orientalis]
MTEPLYVRWLEDLDNDDVSSVGGKNASLGEMIGNLREQGVRVPGGFATTADAYRAFVAHNELEDTIRELTEALAREEKSLKQVGKDIREAFRHGEFPEDIEGAIRDAYEELAARNEKKDLPVAVRSSATAEDLPEASFAGQQETFLNIRGGDDLIDACRKCYASLFTDRALNYREHRGFDHLELALSVGVQKMVGSDKACAGVMFSLDTDTGFPDVVVINATWGLGETVVQGTVDPDEYRVFKPGLENKDQVPILSKKCGSKKEKMIYASRGSAPTRTVNTKKAERETLVLGDDDILTLARWAVSIEKHYHKPMDMEWAKDSESGELYCVQARPETVHSQKQSGAFKSYRLEGTGEVLSRGVAIGESIAAGRVRVLDSPKEIDRFEDGDVLVTERTDPDWGPVMKRAMAIITDHGGRTSHAAIVSRELGVPAVVGTGSGTRDLKDGQEVTVSCAEGSEGRIYEGILEYEEKDIDTEDLPEAPVELMINLAAPDAAFRWWRLPVRGVGLARMEFIINNVIKIHPLALARFDEVEDRKARKRIEELTAGYEDKTGYFIEHLSRGIAMIAASQYPDPVIVRMSDFKTNEYAKLIGGDQFEPREENPMLGFRGASRYYSDRYKDGFALECQAVKKAREEIGLDNIVVMLPFVRNPREADRVIEVMAEHGLRRGEDGLQLYMMCEIPSNVFLAEQFAERFDGFSIGSNDLTQLVLGVDRDSEELSELFDERDEAVKTAIVQVIEKAHQSGCKVGICGQAPSDYPDFAQFLVDSGIDSISLNPDSVLDILEIWREDKSR